MIHDSYLRTRQGDFTCEGVRGFDLNGKTLGVLGTGMIGSKVIEIAKGFKMKVLAFDRSPNLNLANALGFQNMEWPDLLAQSDIVTLHFAFNKNTFHFLNEDTMSRMKKAPRNQHCTRRTY
jgi:D-lactate dehydrogenase